jgi:CHAT domain-containing protein
LGDEICYVYERKNQKKFVGNTLEKPGILLKRTFVRDTNFDKEDLNQDKDFKDGLNDRISQIQAEVRNQAVGSKQATVIQNTQDSMLNFLKNPALLYTNLRLSKDGSNEVLIPDFPVTKYSTIQVIATNLNANISRTFEVEAFTSTSYNDQRNVSQLQKDLDYCEKRKFYGLEKGVNKISILSDCNFNLKFNIFFCIL